MKFVMFCKNISGMFCWEYNLIKCVFLIVVLENNMLLLLIILMGIFIIWVKLYINVVLYCVLNLLKWDLLIRCVIILWMLYGVCGLVGIIFSNLDGL